MDSEFFLFDDFSISPFLDSPIDFLQDPIFENPEDEFGNLEQIQPTKFENLSIYQKPNSRNDLNFETQFSDFSVLEKNEPTKFENLSISQKPISRNDLNFETQLSDFSDLEANEPTKFENLYNSQKPNSQNDLNFETQFTIFSDLEVKIKDFQIPNHSVLGYQSFGPHSYGGAENVERFMQRSFSSSSFNGKPSFVFGPNLNSVLENQNFCNQIMSYKESGQMRRACSTGDLHVTKLQGTDSSPLGVESSFSEEANLKVGRYSAEEKKERIQRYRAKRNQRNFNKTIKYACRKTLADNRPRVRGRFARNDEFVEIPKTANFNLFEDEDERWVEGYNEEERRVRGGTVFNVFSPTQFQYRGFS